VGTRQAVPGLCLPPGRRYSGVMKTRLLTISALLCAVGTVLAEDAPPPRLEKVTPRISVIVAGFNGAITVFASEKGPVVVDTADAKSAQAVQALIKGIDPRAPAAVILTHYHGDHSGGLATLSSGSPVFGQAACLASLKTEERKTPEDPLGKASLVVALAEGASLQLGTDTVRLIHPHPAHTGGDTVVVFEQEKVIAAGDLFFNGLPPYIDVADGADTANWAATIEDLCQKYPGYQVVPGHGPLADTTGWLYFAKYLRALRQGVIQAIQAGKTREEAQASVRLEEFSSIKDVGDFLTRKANVGWVYDELTKQK
jgi:cyclase